MILKREKPFPRFIYSILNFISVLRQEELLKSLEIRLKVSYHRRRKLILVCHAEEFLIAYPLYVIGFSLLKFYFIGRYIADYYKILA